MSGTKNKSRRYRNKTVIVKDILESLPDKRVRIMYKSEVSFTQLKGYLKELQRMQLMQFNEDSREYHITERGTRYLELFSRLKEGLKDLE